jgi:hypothetical protein
MSSTITYPPYYAEHHSYEFELFQSYCKAVLGGRCDLDLWEDSVYCPTHVSVGYFLVWYHLSHSLLFGYV